VAGELPPGTDLAGLVAALESPRLGGALETPGVLEVGRARLTPAAGTGAWALVAAGRPCGILFDGPVAFTYRVEDRFTIPLARRNLRRAGDVKTSEEEGALVLTKVLRGAAVWGWDLPGLVAGAPEGRAGEPPGWLRDLLAKKLDANPGRDLATTLLNGPEGYRFGLLPGAGDDLVLDFDPRPAARVESLSRARKLPSGLGSLSGRWVSEALVSQPVGRTWWGPTELDLASVATELELVNPKGERLEVTARTQVAALRDGIRVLPLSLSTWRLDGKRVRHDYAVRSLTVDGRLAPHHHFEHTLLVLLPRPLAKGEVTRLEVRVEGDLLERPDGDSYWRLGGSWYPRPGTGGVEWAAFDLSLTVPAPFVPFLPGEIVARQVPEGGNRVVTRLRGPMESIFAAAGKYRTITEEHEGQRVHVSTYAGAKEDEARRVARIVLAVRGCYEAWFGVPYPFPDLQVVEVNDWGWGQAPPGFVFLTREALTGRARSQLDEESAFLSSITRRGVNARVAHEVAHGYFPHVVKIVTAEENWLSESFSDYVSAVCLERSMSDRRKARELFEGQLREWRTATRELPEGDSVFLAGHVSGTEDAGERWFKLLYGKGPLVLHTLRQELVARRGERAGDDLFLSWLRAVVTTFAYQATSTERIVALLEEMTGEPWQPWFERYVYGSERPPTK